MSINNQKTGVLLINVGTPDSPEPGDVRRYLRQFLSDPRVIDINPIGRWLLLNLVILPFRPKKSGEAYRQIWRKEGSPLRIYCEEIKDGLQNALGDDYCVELGMRYGNPSLEKALNSFHSQGIDRLVLFPLYPQYAASSTGTSLEEIYRLVGQRWNVPDITTVSPFYDDEGFIDAVKEVGNPVLAKANADHILFSFHGLPERHMRKSDESGSHCLTSPNCCDKIVAANRNCYKAQCYVTARMAAEAMGLEEGKWSVAFQSRLGRTPWIQPYTDEVIPELAEKGCKRMVVFCSAFVADCLETLEEIGIRAKEDFIEAGGEYLELVPAVNAHPTWIDAAAKLVLNSVGKRA